MSKIRPSWIDIVEALRSGNTRRSNNAVLVLYDAVEAQVKNFVLSNSGTIEDVEDVLQEGVAAFILSSRKEHFTISGSYGSYLFGVCRNIWFKKLSKKSRLPFDELKDYSLGEEIEEDKDEGVIGLISRMMKDLSEECQRLLKLFYYDRLAMSEIAVRMGYKQSTVAKTKKYKCIQALKTRVTDHPDLKSIFD